MKRKRRNPAHAAVIEASLQLAMEDAARRLDRVNELANDIDIKEKALTDRELLQMPLRTGRKQ